MKQFLIFIFMTALSTQASIASTVAISPEGYWRNDRNGVVIQIIRTSYGIKTKRNDQSRWYYYDRIRDGIYRDEEGNEYHISDNDSLIWRSYDGRNGLIFRRTYRGSGTDDRYYEDYRDYDDRYNDRYDDDYRYRDPYRNDQYRYDNPNRNQHYRSFWSISGTWYNYKLGSQLHIQPKKDRLMVRLDRHGPVSNFYLRSPGYFADRFGNTIRVYRDKLVYHNWRRGGKIDFYRSGRYY